MSSRRGFLKGAGSAVLATSTLTAQQRAGGGLSADLPEAPPILVWKHDQRTEALLQRQIVDERNPNAGGYPDEWEIVSPQSGSGAIATFATAFLCRQSRFHQDPDLLRQLLLAARFLDRKQLASGNIDLLTTNFDSPPDTGFVVHNVAVAAILGRRAGVAEVVNALMPFLRKAAQAMAVGGVHTPNHRWVICSALALIHHLEPDSRYLRRIEQWLGEGIDIDEDGLYTERSPLVYSPVVNRSLIYLAEFLGRPELLEPVRSNLEAALYLMHANGELETGLSGRQDQNTIGYMGVNWLGLHYAGEHFGNGVFVRLARRADGDHGDLSQWMLLPTIQTRKTAEQSPPENFRKVFRHAALHRIRRGELSASIFAQDHDRLFSIRFGDAVVEAVRCASAFFGKGQLIPDTFATGESSIEMIQSLSGPYFQPLEPAELVPADPASWSRFRQFRRTSEVCLLTQRCRIFDDGSAFEVEFAVEGTPNVPVAVEVNLRPGNVAGNVRTCPAAADSFLSTGEPILIRGVSRSLRVEAPESRHAYTQLRGALAKLRGPSVYVTGFTPFRERLKFRPE